MPRRADATLALLLLCGSASAWLDARYNLGHKPQLPEALTFAQPKCPKGLVVDVGANGGKETNTARAMGYRVLSVECLVEEYMRLQTQWINDPMITLLYGCASDSVGLHAFHHASAGSSMHSSAIANENEMRMFKKAGSRTRTLSSSKGSSRSHTGRLSEPRTRLAEPTKAAQRVPSADRANVACVRWGSSGSHAGSVPLRKSKFIHRVL